MKKKVVKRIVKIILFIIRVIFMITEWVDILLNSLSSHSVMKWREDNISV